MKMARKNKEKIIKKLPSMTEAEKRLLIDTLIYLEGIGYASDQSIAWQEAPADRLDDIIKDIYYFNFDFNMWRTPNVVVKVRRRDEEYRAWAKKREKIAREVMASIPPAIDSDDEDFETILDYAMGRLNYEDAVDIVEEGESIVSDYVKAKLEEVREKIEKNDDDDDDDDADFFIDDLDLSSPEMTPTPEPTPLPSVSFKDIRKKIKEPEPKPEPTPEPEPEPEKQKGKEPAKSESEEEEGKEPTPEPTPLAPPTLQESETEEISVPSTPEPLPKTPSSPKDEDKPKGKEVFIPSTTKIDQKRKARGLKPLGDLDQPPKEEEKASTSLTQIAKKAEKGDIEGAMESLDKKIFSEGKTKTEETAIVAASQVLAQAQSRVSGMSESQQKETLKQMDIRKNIQEAVQRIKQGGEAGIGSRALGPQRITEEDLLPSGISEAEGTPTPQPQVDVQDEPQFREPVPQVIRNRVRIANNHSVANSLFHNTAIKIIAERQNRNLNPFVHRDDGLLSIYNRYRGSY
jgi:hypothetical protein